MVNVSVTEYGTINLCGVERKIAIPFDGFVAVTLKKPAFQQQLSAVNLQQIKRSGGGASGSEKMDTHGGA